MAKRSFMPLLIGVVGAALVGLLVYGVMAQASKRTLDEAIKHGRHPTAPAGQHQHAAALRRRKPLACLLSRACRRVELLGVLVHALPGRVADSGACSAHAGAPRWDRARRDLSRFLARLAYFVKHYGVSYPNLRDTTGEFAQAYGTTQIPETFVIDSSGDVVAISRGEIDEAFLNHAIALAESV